MRWVFFTLVLMNLAYLGYEVSQIGQEPVSSDIVKVDEQLEAAKTKIALLSETKGLKTKRQVSKDDPMCWAVGSFAAEIDAKHVYARMLAVDIDAKVTDRETLLKQEYWVYLPPHSNRKQALRKLRELQKRKVDSYIITEGELENGISLGLFGKQSSVDRLVEKLKKKNITPEVKTIDRTKKEYWVVAQVQDINSIDSKLKNHLTDGAEHEWRQVTCQ